MYAESEKYTSGSAILKKGERKLKKIICITIAFIMLLTSSSFVLASDLESEGEKYVYRNDTYQFSIIEDDPMFITDEEFFGSWDEYGDIILEPYFDYEKFPGLAEVESAAKKGDYETAKEALYEYYLPQKYNKVSPSRGVTSNYAFEIEMQARNLYTAKRGGDPLAVTKFVGQEWETVQVNTKRILDNVKSYASAGSPITFVVASIDKSNTPAEIKSIDSDSPPTLSLVVNNVQKVFTAVEDAYISPGINQYTNYGSEEILYAQEYGYVGHWDDPNYPWGEESSDTKRTYIKFDLSSLSASDTISAASFNFDARTAEGGDLTEKELLIYGWGDSSWKERTFTWSTFSDWLFFSCNEQEVWNFMTTWEVPRKGKLCEFHRGARLSPLASMYDFTKDEKYAYTFLRNFMSMIYNVGGDNVDVMNALDMSCQVNTSTQDFIKMWGSKHLTPTMFTAFIKHFYLMTDVIALEYLEKETHWNNWATTQTAATYRFTRCFPELKRSEYWYDCTLRHNKRLLDIATFEDGVCIEQGMSYVSTYLGTYDAALDVLENTVTDVYGGFCDDDGKDVLHDIVINMYYSLGPGYRGFGFSDSLDYGGSFKSTLVTWYGYLKKLGIDDPILKYVATDGIEGTEPDFTSIGFPDAKRTYMRSDWSENGIALGFTAKGDNAYHNHNDVLHISLIAYGRDLLVDPGYGAILTGDTKEYMIQGAQHNAITVNGGNINANMGNDGVEKEQELNDLYDLTTYTHGYVDNASNTERTVLFLKNQRFFIVSDYVQPVNNTKVNTYTQFWHMVPSANIYISDDGENAFRSKFNSGPNIIVSPVDSESMSDVRLDYSKFSPGDGMIVDNQKGVYERRSMGNVKYGTVLYPLEGGDDREITTEAIDVGISGEGASAFRIRIKNPKNDSVEIYYYYHISDLSQKREVELGGYKTDATAMLVQEDISGKAISFFVYDGSYIEKSDLKDKWLFKSTMGNVNIAVNVNSGNCIEISSEFLTEDDLENITAYTSFASSRATFNGDSVSRAKKDGAYVYFGDLPIVESTETAPEGTGNNNSFGSFTGGGGGGGGASLPPKEDTEDEKVSDDITDVESDSFSNIILPTYNDVKVSNWCFPFIEDLTEKGIISGDGTGNFNPDSKVTREQFLKMLILASCAETEEAENTFEDVNYNDWYASYVLKAKKLGIVNGISDTEFGIGNNITRQDMAVMIARVLEIKGINVEDSNVVGFSDAKDVSDYAKNSVNFMKSIGLVEGYNNQYRPLDNLTKAEAAKVISGLMNYLMEE